jgi:hypothetical protein
MASARLIDTKSNNKSPVPKGGYQKFQGVGGFSPESTPEKDSLPRAKTEALGRLHKVIYSTKM